MTDAKKFTADTLPILEIDGATTEGLNQPNRKPASRSNSSAVIVDTTAQLNEQKSRSSAHNTLLTSLVPGGVHRDEKGFCHIVKRGAELSGSQFHHCWLTGAKFNKSNLIDAEFHHCDLQGVDFRGADLSAVTFDHCNLTGADFRGAKLHDGHFIECKLTAVNFDHCDVEYARILHCLLEAVSLHSCRGNFLHLHNSTLIHCFLESSQFGFSHITDTVFDDCTISHCSFHHGHINDTAFIRCDSVDHGPSFSDGILNRCRFEDCDWVAVDFTQTSVQHSELARVSLWEASFDGAHFNDVSFIQTEIHDGFTVNKPPAFEDCEMKRIVINHTDLSQAVFRNSAIKEGLVTNCDHQHWRLDEAILDINTVFK